MVKRKKLDGHELEFKVARSAEVNQNPVGSFLGGF